jgi:hypothetical protein
LDSKPHFFKLFAQKLLTGLSTLTPVKKLASLLHQCPNPLCQNLYCLPKLNFTAVTPTATKKLNKNK